MLGISKGLLTMHGSGLLCELEAADQVYHSILVGATWFAVTLLDCFAFGGSPANFLMVDHLFCCFSRRFSEICAKGVSPRCSVSSENGSTSYRASYLSNVFAVSFDKPDNVVRQPLGMSLREVVATISTNCW